MKSRRKQELEELLKELNTRNKNRKIRKIKAEKLKVRAIMPPPILVKTEKETQEKKKRDKK